MNRAELEKKHVAELHALAAEAGIERYRMLPRAELIAKLADGDSGSSSQPSRGAERERSERSEGDRPPRRRSRGGRKRTSAGEGSGGGAAREPRSRTEPRAKPERAREPEPASDPEPDRPAPTAPTPPTAPGADQPSSRPRRRRRRRFGRRGKQEVTLQGLLLPPASRQALLAAETRAGCTALLRGIAADLAADSNGPDPVALLIDPSPEELADWRRDAPLAEIVAAGQPRHADDALAQARARAAAGDHVILLVDSLTRLGEAYEDAEAAKQFFDAGRAVTGPGSLTVVAALERPASSS